jgi:hypothetical protein
VACSYLLLDTHAPNNRLTINDVKRTQQAWLVFNTNIHPFGFKLPTLVNTPTTFIYRRGVGVLVAAVIFYLGEQCNWYVLMMGF